MLIVECFVCENEIKSEDARWQQSVMVNNTKFKDVVVCNECIKDIYACEQCGHARPYCNDCI